MIEKLEGVVKVDGLPIVTAGFNWSVGVLMEKFIKSLADKKLLAGKCPSCDYVILPPRTRCYSCGSKIAEKDLIQVEGKGVLVSYTTAHVELDGKAHFVDLKEPKVVGAVKLDGVNSTIFVPLLVDPKKLEIGMKLQIEWSDKPKGAISDIKGFKP